MSGGTQLGQGATPVRSSGGSDGERLAGAHHIELAEQRGRVDEDKP